MLPRSVSQSVLLFLLVGLLVAVASSVPLLLRSAAQATWLQDRDRIGPAALGATVSSGVPPDSAGPLSLRERLDRVPALDVAVRREGEILELPPPRLATVFPRSPLATGSTAQAAPLRLLSRDGAEGAVRLLSGAPSADGVLMPADAAERLGVGVGDTVALEGEGSARVRVAGTYEPLEATRLTFTPAPLPEYWVGFGYLFYPRVSEDGGLIAADPVALVPRALQLRLAAELDEPLSLQWVFGLPASPDLDGVRRHSSAIETLNLRLSAPDRPAGPLFDDVGFAPQVRTALPDVLAGVAATVALLRPPARAVGIGGVLAALCLVGAWAGLRVRRLDRELRALLARGLGPGASLGSVLGEALLPVLLGTAAGVGGGLLAVSVVGPVPVPADFPALLWAAGAALAALLLLGAVTLEGTARLGRVGTGVGAQLAARVPWVGVLAAGTVVAALPLLRAPQESGPALGVLTLLVPLLAVVVAAAVLTGALQRASSRWRPALSGSSTSTVLAVRRVIGATGAARLVVVVLTLAVGLVGFAGAINASTERTLAVKAVVASGAEVVVSVDSSVPQPKEPPGTQLIHVDTRVDVLPGSSSVDLQVLEPARFADRALWDPSLADRPLPELLRALTDYRGDRVPVLVAGPLPAAVREADGGRLTLDSLKYRVPVQVVGTTRAWPGMGSRPLLVVPQDRFTAALARVDRTLDNVTRAQVWAEGDPQQVAAAVLAAGNGTPRSSDIRTPADFRSRPALRAQGFALGYLQAVSVLGGLLGVVALLLYGAAQQRRRTVAGVLLQRMGLSPAAAARSSALEIALLGGLATLTGVLVSLPLARVLLGRIDPVPDLPPGALFAAPWGTLLLLATGLLLSTVLGAALVQRVSRRTSGGEVLRGAD